MDAQQTVTQRLLQQRRKWDSNDCMDAAQQLSRLEAENADLRERLAACQPAQEPEAWFVMRHNPGGRDHGLKLGPWWKRKDAEEWTNESQSLHALHTTPQHQSQALTDDRVIELTREVERLNAIVNTPQANDFLRAVSTESEHQRQRWGNEHDAGKAPADWFWLIGYLAGKALHAHVGGNIEKAEHHIITTAAACANWHLSMFGRTTMRPGIDGEAAHEIAESKAA